MAERDGRWLTSGGLDLVRQRPGSAKGVMFMTLEDETGIINGHLTGGVQALEAVGPVGVSGSDGKIQPEGDVCT